jgi:hypothetical protein
MSEPSVIQELLKPYQLDLSLNEIHDYLTEIETAQKFFSSDAQKALLIRLLHDSDSDLKSKIVTASGIACRTVHGVCITAFGILSPDWAGLSNVCLGVINAMGWNIYHVNGFTMRRNNQEHGIVIIGVRTDCEEDYQKLLEQTTTILSRLISAAHATQGKASILFEEIKKMLIYTSVITQIEATYTSDDLKAIIGPEGEAVHYFNARSRDYIENRSVPDIAQQIIRNYTFIREANKTSTIQLDISNFTTEKEGAFTGVTIAGPAHMLKLEDSLKTIELTIPGFILKHNREFTTHEGISCYRIEMVDQMGHPLAELEQNRLKRAFSNMVLNKRRDRAQWIESIGGFEQYARAIIPLLVREAQNTEIPQVYQSVDRATDLFIVFKIIAVVPNPKISSKEMLNLIVKKIENEPGLHILSVKPSKMYGNALLHIIDIKASLVDLENTEAIYRLIREKLREAIGQYRDFDEGMRSIDTTKLKTLQRMITDIDPGLIREIYYTIEDFHRISATINELTEHIRLTCELIQRIEKENRSFGVMHKQAGTHNKAGDLIPQASLIGIAYDHQLELLEGIMHTLGEYELTMSRMERTGKDLIICRITKNDKALSDKEIEDLSGTIERLIEKRQTEAKSPVETDS